MCGKDGGVGRFFEQLELTSALIEWPAEHVFNWIGPISCEGVSEQLSEVFQKDIRTVLDVQITDIDKPGAMRAQGADPGYPKALLECKLEGSQLLFWEKDW